MKRMAFLLGTEKYKEYGPTNFCHNDVVLLKETLINYCGFAEQDIFSKLLRPDDDLKPMDILSEIKSLVDKSNDGDTILFYYAGHGTFYNGDSYLILPNTCANNKEQTALPLRDISNLLREKNRINIRIFDTCHSGQDVRSDLLENLDYNSFTRNILTGSAEGWITFASCREDQVSYGDPGLQNGVFTYYLTEAIQDFAEDEVIYPEILKIKVCEKVAKWCIDHQKTQTPTFNAAVSGNISIAIRKKLIVEISTVQTPAELVSSVNIRSIEDRLSKLRKFERIGDEKHREGLTKYISEAKNVLIEQLIKMPQFGVIPEVSDILNADDIPDDIKPLITRIITSKDLRTLHEIEVIRHYEKKNILSQVGPFSHWNKAFEGIGKLLYQDTEPKVISITHNISQDIIWPESYFEVEVDSDGYVPYGKIFVYIVPLLATACFICGISVDYDDENQRDMKKISLDPIYLKFNEDDDMKLINSQITLLIDTFNQHYSEITLKRLEYLEWEVSQ